LRILIGLGAALADSFYGFLAGGGLVFLSKFLLEISSLIKIIGGFALLAPIVVGLFLCSLTW